MTRRPFEQGACGVETDEPGNSGDKDRHSASVKRPVSPVSPGQDPGKRYFAPVARLRRRPTIVRGGGADRLLDDLVPGRLATIAKVRKGWIVRGDRAASLWGGNWRRDRAPVHGIVDITGSQKRTASGVILL